MSTQTSRAKARPLFDPPIVRRAIIDAFIKLNPRHQIKNPVMFTVEVVSLLTTLLWLQWVFSGKGEENSGFVLAISVWLWFTVVFANFAEAMAEGRGKAQADTLRATKKDTPAQRVRNGREETVSSSELRKGDIVVVREGEIIPGDGEVVEGVAYVNEAA